MKYLLFFGIGVNYWPRLTTFAGFHDPSLQRGASRVRRVIAIIGENLIWRSFKLHSNEKVKISN
jgi:hypothetical protein